MKLLLKTEVNLLVNEKTVKKMGKVHKYGRMDLNLKEYELTIILMVLENFIISLEIFMKANGLMEKLMEKELIMLIMG